MTTGYLSVDGTQYAVPIITCKRTLNFLDRFAERTQDGMLHRQLIGVYINYQVTFGKPHTLAAVATYAALFLALAQATEWHTFIMPDGFSFVGYVGDGASDDVRKVWNSTVFWENLTVSLIAQSPEATP
jgi:hypothetical protein